MKLSKTLLNAVFIGMTAGAVTSCVGLTDTVSELHEEGTDIVKCEVGEDDSDTKNTWQNCLACGMG